MQRAPTPGSTPESKTQRWVSLVLLGGGVQSLLRLALAAVTARLISPEETGLFQIAISIVLVAVAIGDPGLAEAVVRRPAQTRASRSTVFWVNIGFGAVVAALVLGFAGPITAALGAPQSRPLMLALAALPLLAALSLGPLVELRRQRRFGAIAVVEVGANFAGCAACVAMALAGTGAWALVGYQAVFSATRAAGMFALAPAVPTFVFRRHLVRRLAGFGLNVWAARLVGVAGGQLDKVVLGGILGMAALGFYSRATLFVTLPLQLIATAVTTVLVPVLARARADTGELRREFLGVSSAIATFTFPAFVAGAALAEPIVTVVLGRGTTWDWAGVAPLLAVLAPAAALESLVLPQRALFMARNRAGLALLVSVAGTGLLLLGVGMGALWGLHGAVIGYVVASVLTFGMSTALVLRVVAASLRDYLGALLRTAAAAAAMGAALVIAAPALATVVASPLVQLLLLAALGGLVYAACLGPSRLARLLGQLRAFPAG